MKEEDRREYEEILIYGKDKYHKTINGRRVTTDCNGEYQNKLFIWGNSLAWGSGSEDKNTISSFMQRFLNESSKPYKVINCTGGRISYEEVKSSLW